jgi:uncharacterized protein YecE (DUF72 family)
LRFVQTTRATRGGSECAFESNMSTSSLLSKPGSARSQGKPRQTGRIHVGTAGWSYADWEGVLYPKPHPRGFDPLEYLSRYVDVVEVNSTFYRPVDADVARRWIDRVAHAPHFAFTAKLFKRFTHERDTAFTRSEVAEVVRGFRPMHNARKLGAVLLQFPWSFRRNDDNRIWLDDVTRAFDEFPLVVEVRHESWSVPEFYEELAERGIGFVNIDQPLFKNSIKPSATATAPVGYVRIHGRNYHEWFRKDAGVEARYDYLYPPVELQPWAERTVQVAEAGADEVYTIANNHYRAQAAVNAIQLKSMIVDEPVAAPDTLYSEYEEELAPWAYPA